MAAESQSPLNRDSTEELGHLREKNQNPALSDQFEPSRQTWHLFKDQAAHLAVTITLVSLFIMTLVLWESRNISHEGKVWFNTIMTILNLALALNFAGAFKDMAKVFRWRVLSTKTFTPREVDLILGGQSLMKLIRLLLESLRPLKLKTVLVCAIWIFLNFLAQATIAMLSLNYSMDSGTDSTGIYTQNGTVNAANLDCYYLNRGCPPAVGVSMITAHAYGEFVSSQKNCVYHNDSEIHSADQSCSYFSNANGNEFAYRYNEYNPDDTVGSYPYLTNRVIKTSVGQCYQYDIDWNRSPFINTPDGISATQVLAFTNGTYTGHLPIPKSEGAYNSTTYIYNGTQPPMDETATACGGRCLWMYVYRLADPNPPGNQPALPSHIFSCPISISEVYNATEDWHNLSKETARLAIASIALTGRYTSPSSGIDWQQYQLYTWGSYWEVYQRNAQTVGANIALFAIGSLANMAALNPKQLKPGTLPILGYHLDTTWKYIVALAVCIGVAHCLLVAAILWISRPIFVPDDSDLSTARLLHSLVGKLDGRGSLLSGEKLATELQGKISDEDQKLNAERTGKESGQVVYGISQRHDVEHIRTLDIGDEMVVRKRLKGGRFPKGLYA